MSRSSKDIILEAAETVVANDGAAHLTLDAVALRAGLSKGGLLYHFPSKEALLQAMLARLLERADSDRKKFQEDFPQGPASDLQALVRAGFNQRPDEERVCAAMLAAGANDLRLLDPVRHWHRRNFEELARSKKKPTRAAVVILALDGLWLNDLLRTLPLSSEERQDVLQELLELAKSTDEGES